MLSYVQLTDVFSDITFLFSAVPAGSAVFIGRDVLLQVSTALCFVFYDLLCYKNFLVSELVRNSTKKLEKNNCMQFFSIH